MKNRHLSGISLVCINLLWVIVIFTLCLIPGDKIPNPHLEIPHIDKAVHFVMFFISAILIIVTLHRFTRITYRKIYLMSNIYILILGGTIEILQESFFQRNGDLWDVAADIAGGIIACLCYHKLKHKLK